MNGQLRIAELAKPLDNLTGVDQVRSLYQPTGDPPGATRVFSTEGLKVLAAKGNPLTQAVFVSQAGRLEGKITRLFLIPTDAPFSPEAVQTCAEVERVLETLRTDPDSTWHGARFELLGPTAGIRDLERVTQADQRRIQLLVAGAVLLVIFALLRKPLVCCYLIATVVLSYLVTMGLTEIVFSHSPRRGLHRSRLEGTFIFVCHSCRRGSRLQHLPGESCDRRAAVCWSATRIAEGACSNGGHHHQLWHHHGWHVCLDDDRRNEWHGRAGILPYHWAFCSIRSSCAQSSYLPSWRCW